VNNAKGKETSQDPNGMYHKYINFNLYKLFFRKLIKYKMSQNGNDIPSNQNSDFGTNGSHGIGHDGDDMDSLKLEIFDLKVFNILGNIVMCYCYNSKGIMIN
jgi:hypothetical protein